jgi:hypothetical protein
MYLLVDALQYGTFGIRIHSDFYRAFNVIEARQPISEVCKIESHCIFQWKELQQFIEHHIYLYYAIWRGN